MCILGVKLCYRGQPALEGITKTGVRIEGISAREVEFFFWGGDLF